MDWKNLIAELKAHKFTEAQIAEACGCAQSTINALGNGVAKTTRYEIGSSLEALLKKARRRKGAIAQQEA
jgi:hypothetical protein